MTNKTIWLGVLLHFCSLFLLCSCEVSPQPKSGAVQQPQWNGKSLFEPLSQEESGIAFSNDLAFDEDFNIYTYRNFYNGGGVAMGDVNNDGLPDLYFTGNMVQNELYLNEGNLNFKVATSESKTAGNAAWSTGASMADVNGDGWLDIYVCNSGEVSGDNKRNELFINQQDGTFKEMAAEYGIADEGYGTHGVFFDYDRDGDLDLYLLNNSYQAIGSFNLQKNERPKRDSVGGDKLFRNDMINANGPTKQGFTDVSEAAGIYGSVIGFGLGVTVGDIDRDGWPDIYVSNDFFERDYLYMNNGDGTFRETLTESMNSISAASMGADFADINNDGYGEIFVTEMLPEPNVRIKTATTFESWNRYQYNLENDYYHQFTRNMLQRNNGDGTFSEIGRMSGVAATDWSWGALIFDMDNDGYKDLFVANGIYQDLTNRDFLDFIGDEETKRAIITKEGVNYKALVDAIPSNPVPNYAYRNLGPAGDYRFEKVSQQWGLDFTGFSNGSAYGDLDNDGDLDLVINNSNFPALVYRNHAIEQGTGNYLSIELKGEKLNTAAMGTKVFLYANGKEQYLEQMPVRGFESTIDNRLHFGLGSDESIDSLLILWPDDKVTKASNLKANQYLVFAQKDGINTENADNPLKRGVNVANTLFVAKDARNYSIDFVHQENRHSDFDRDPLLFHMASSEGPKMCQGDFNGDGMDDFYIGGSKGQAGQLYLYSQGSYLAVGTAIFETDKNSEDTDCACFDADGDGDLDLYVTSGSSEFNSTDLSLMDRLYINEGRGIKWTKSKQFLPSSSKPVVSSCVKPYDVDQDGDLDLFVGGRMRSGLYGAPTESYLLLNNGKGEFSDAKATAFKELGMVTDAAWVDLDEDGAKELVVVGEWMSPQVFRIEEGVVAEVTEQFITEKLAGWYNTITVADLNGDGLEDLALGNHGLNSRFKATNEHPVTMHLNDFDQNGKAEQIVSIYEGNKAYPMSLLHDLNKQIPGLRKRFLKYEDFGDKTLQDIFDPEVLARSLILQVTELRSLVLLQQNKQLVPLFLPIEVQESPLYAIKAIDVDADGDLDLVTGGNFYRSKPEVGRYDADRGDVLINDGKANFTAASLAESGFAVTGEVRDILWLKGQLGNRLLVSRNDDVPALFTPQ